jgi:SAM-dependent methyltransferase
MDPHEAAIGQVNRAWEWFTGLVALSATNLGIELGLFDALRDHGPQTSTALADRLNLQPRPVDTWAKTLLHNGLLVDVGNERVDLAPGVELMVCEPVTFFNLAPSFAYHARFLARDFLDLEALFRAGEHQPPSRHGPALTHNIAAQTRMMHSVFLTGMLPELPELLDVFAEGGKVLDAGCGTANLGVLLCTEFPTVRYTGIDADETAVSLARDEIRANSFGHRAGVFAGDLSRFPLERDFDLAMVFLSLHEFPEATRPQALRALYEALRPGGLLFVFDETFPATLADAIQPEARMGLHFEYSEMLWGSRLVTESELNLLLSEAGFTSIEHRPLMGGGVRAVLARKQ